MSAHDQMRAMLDQLMGTTRDGDSDRTKVRFDDPRVCKSFLLACCPHDILASTRMDLGECPKVHDLALRADFETACKKRDYFYDIDAMEHLESFIGECDRKVELAKRRLKETQEELSEEATSKAERIHHLGEMIGINLAKAEEEGAKGNVEASKRCLEEVENIKKEKTAAEIDYRNSMPASSYQQQKLRVCEICSAYLGIHDNDRRLADHFGGKLHLGFIEIRDKLDGLRATVQERRQQREREREERRNQRQQRSRSRSRSKGSRRRSRSRDRDRRRRSRSRNKHRSRSRSKDRRRRSRSKDRRRSRSRDRRRSRRTRSRERRRSRSRSRSRRSHRRSRSKSRRSDSRSRRSAEPSHSDDANVNGDNNEASESANSAVPTSAEPAPEQEFQEEVPQSATYDA